MSAFLPIATEFQRRGELSRCAKRRHSHCSRFSYSITSPAVASSVGGTAAALVAAGLLALGVPIGAGILISLPGAAASFLLLRRYFARRPPAAEPAMTSVLPRQIGP